MNEPEPKEPLHGADKPATAHDHPRQVVSRPPYCHCVYCLQLRGSTLSCPHCHAFRVRPEMFPT